MDTQILQLQAPYEYIYCNGEVGKHIATLIVSESSKDAEGRLQLTTHSYPVVKYWNAPQGVVWDKAELTDCVVLCDDSDKRVDIVTFNMVSMQWFFQENGRNEEERFLDPDELFAQCKLMKEKLCHFGIGFKLSDGSREEKVSLEIGSCREGYFSQTIDYFIFYSHFTEKTTEELIARLLEERQDWEELYDHAVKIRFVAESSLARQLNVEAL